MGGHARLATTNEDKERILLGKPEVSRSRSANSSRLLDSIPKKTTTNTRRAGAFVISGTLLYLGLEIDVMFIFVDSTRSLRIHWVNTPQDS